MYTLINNQLADDLLTDILNQSAAFFEHLVVDLMKAMDYGDGFVTKYSGDDGIDGIVHEDKLGFNLIYIQAKRWKPDTTIGKPELQKFAGAMMGPPRVDKGLFITTAKFSPKAKEYANAQHIILVDGEKLTNLMIEHGVGVSTQRLTSLSASTAIISRKTTDQKRHLSVQTERCRFFMSSYQILTISRVISARECAPHICMVSASSAAILSM